MLSSSDLIEVLTPPPAGLTDGVAGWLTPTEEAALYRLGRYLPGPILEIGPWLGRSTICIAKGIQASPDPVGPLFTVELNPTAANWRLDADGILQFHPDLDGPSLGANTVEDYEANIAPVVEHPDGVVGQLIANLDAHGVLDTVAIYEGDVNTLTDIDQFGPYRFIFTDATHTPDEVHRNASRLAGLLRSGGVLACHDTTPENRAALGQYLEFSTETQVDSLFIGRVA